VRRDGISGQGEGAVSANWSEQQRIEFQAPEYLRNIIRIITETGLRVYKELMPMKKEQIDQENTLAWIPDSKTPNGIAEVPITQLLRQGDAKVFKKYSQMKLQMKREALKKLNRKANEGQPGFDTERPN
jgi:hypothetical protein